MLFPRVYDRGHAQMYNTWMGRAADDMSQPTFGDNLTYFFNYQLTYMYWRYFMWNFAGRQNDLQGDGGSCVVALLRVFPSSIASSTGIAIRTPRT